MLPICCSCHKHVMHGGTAQKDRLWQTQSQLMLMIKVCCLHMLVWHADFLQHSDSSIAWSLAPWLYEVKYGNCQLQHKRRTLLLHSGCWLAASGISQHTRCQHGPR